MFGEGTCESLGEYVTIMDSTTCEAAAEFLGKSDTTVDIHTTHGAASDRPAGCTYHPYENLELWTESTGVCTFGLGCLCQISNRGFHIASSQMSLPDARAYCEDRDQFLVVPRSEAETSSIRAILPNEDLRAWLGINQLSDMRWVRDDTGASLDWTNWKGNDEGNDGRGTTAGAAMVWETEWQGQWYDMTNNDGRLHYVVCETSSSTSGTPPPIFHLDILPTTPLKN